METQFTDRLPFICPSGIGLFVVRPTQASTEIVFGGFNGI
jgi:hypothetical protein